MKVIDFEALPSLVGQEVATGDWLAITQERIDQFAQATGDHQWIHVDVERAKAGPFGGTIAHGYLTLSLIPKLFETAVQIRNSGMGVNYGLNRVRFTAPVPAGSRIRAVVRLLACQPVEGSGLQISWGVTVQREGSDKPVCVAETLTRRYP